MFLRIMTLSLVIFQSISAMESNDLVAQQTRKPISEDKLNSFINKPITYQNSLDGYYRKGTFGGRVSKEKFSIVYIAERRGITVPNDKIYEDPSCESDIKK